MIRYTPTKSQLTPTAHGDSSLSWEEAVSQSIISSIEHLPSCSRVLLICSLSEMMPCGGSQQLRVSLSQQRARPVSQLCVGVSRCCLSLSVPSPPQQWQQISLCPSGVSPRRVHLIQLWDFYFIRVSRGSADNWTSVV